jgi:hypothetical protein
MRNVLILYCNTTFPMRATIHDHLYAFREYGSFRCFYVNLDLRRLPRYLEAVEFDAIFFHTTFLAKRWFPEVFRAYWRKVEPLKRSRAVKIALPQDEFIHTDILGEFLNEFAIDHVFSVAPESEWPKIYPSVNRERVRFDTLLTGYLSDSTLARINALAAKQGDRPLDIGYRAWRAAPWLGRHGILKAQVNDVFNEESPKRGLTVDISTDPADTFLGDDWYAFLLRCKYTIGVEGGASILDRDGALKAKTEAYTQTHPDADFEEVERHCFPGQDGSLALFAISPRHLEACATRTCQILIEGDYNGILKPERHYIALKRDFSNLDEVLERVRSDQLREIVTRQAYEDIVASGRYTYRHYVETIFGATFQETPPKQKSLPARTRDALAYAWARVEDGMIPGMYQFYRAWLRPLRQRLRR